MHSPHTSLSQIDHRPWSLPNENWAWRQSWYDLAFIHVRVPLESIRDKIPAELEIDTFDGSAWVGIVPFNMVDVMKRGVPSIYPFAHFLELNLRTYVTHEGKSGVWFFSLDTTNLPLVLGGRYLYGVPYHQASMKYSFDNPPHHFYSRRRFSGATLETEFQPQGEIFTAQNGSFEHWATERYCLFSLSVFGRLMQVDVHHHMWPLQHAEGKLIQNDLLSSKGISTHDDSPLFHFSTGVDTISFTPRVLKC